MRKCASSRLENRCGRGVAEVAIGGEGSDEEKWTVEAAEGWLFIGVVKGCDNFGEPLPASFLPLPNEAIIADDYQGSLAV